MRTTQFLPRLARGIAALSGALVVTCGLGLGSTAAAGGLTPFQQDVGTAINNGLTWLANNGAFTGNAGWGTGIATVALLEKRSSGNPNDPPQGYAGASPTDQGRMQTAVAYMITLVSNQGGASGFYAYGYGGTLSALTEYLATGGPEACISPCTPAQLAVTPPPLQNLSNTVLGTINNAVDGTLKAQRSVANGWPNDWHQGYWHYNGGDDTDSSTTQFAALGIAAAQSLYSNPLFGDPGNRLPKISAALSLARQAYALNGAQGSQDPACDVGYTYTTPNPANFPAGFVPNPQLVYNNGGQTSGAPLQPTDPLAFGHGYHDPTEGYAPSLQQTASGLFVQALGGANINDSHLQGYLRWVNDHYRYTDIGGYNGAGNLYDGSWPYSYFYYLWSSFKGIEYLIGQGVQPTGGNLGTTAYGTTPGNVAPVCTDREVHLNPATVTRPPAFGSGGAGYYSAETQSQYFDYAYTLLSYQCNANSGGNTGRFDACSSSTSVGSSNPGSWDGWDGNSYALLVLQRAIGVLAPTATLTSSSANGTAGTPVTLTWTSANANSCAASGGNAGDGWTGANLATNGHLAVTESAAGLVSYTITCSAGSQTAQAQVMVNWAKPAPGLCDLNNDGQVDQRDIALFPQWIGKKVPPAPKVADVNGDGVITVQDERQCVLRCTYANCATTGPKQ